MLSHLTHSLYSKIFLKINILSVEVKIFLYLPCILPLTLMRWVIIYVKYLSFESQRPNDQMEDMTWNVRAFPFSKNTWNFSRSSYMVTLCQLWMAFHRNGHLWLDLSYLLFSLFADLKSCMQLHHACRCHKLYMQVPKTLLEITFYSQHSINAFTDKPSNLSSLANMPI